MQTLAQLPVHAQELSTLAVDWLDAYWDETTGLLWYPGYEPNRYTSHPTHYRLVRETAWYAVGLLLRGNPRDIERAIQALHAVLDQQFDAPTQAYHGTFSRSPEEPVPPTNPLEWKHYDPNWREFVGTTLGLILINYAALLPATLITRIDRALQLAVVGTLQRQVPAAYTNIALMRAFLLAFAAQRFEQPAWAEEAHQIADAIYTRFKQHNNFDEFNSPTYYGTDLYALALWRSYAPSTTMQTRGAEMERLLWDDIARFYHAGLRNLCGPFDRSYGMDLREYVNLLGMWIWLVVGREQAPFPVIQAPLVHAHDLCFAPCVALLGAQLTSESAALLTGFTAAHQIEQIIVGEPPRRATAWLEPTLMIGAEQTDHTRAGHGQFHPATIHWRIDQQTIGWLRLIHTQPADARVTERQLTISAIGPIRFEINTAGHTVPTLTADYWQLPGLMIHVAGAAPTPQIHAAATISVIEYPADAEQRIELALSVVPTKAEDHGNF
jgi:hypothetical protein